MKTILVCPDILPAAAQLAENHPPATIPILGECLIAHWLERVSLLGARQVRVLAPNRPAQVSAVVGDGRRWGVQVEVIGRVKDAREIEEAARRRDPAEPGWLPAPFDVVNMTHLPGTDGFPLFETYSGWYNAITAWIPQAITPGRLRMGEIQPGIWVARRARLAPGSRLVAPCWVGDLAYIGRNAVVGPGAIIEDRAVVEASARVVRSHVGPDTFVGRLAAVENSLAFGDVLMNWQTDSILRVPDPFLLSSLAPRPAAEGRTGFGRVTAALARLAQSPFGSWTPWGSESAFRSKLSD